MAHTTPTRTITVSEIEASLASLADRASDIHCKCDMALKFVDLVMYRLREGAEHHETEVSAGYKSNLPDTIGKVLQELSEFAWPDVATAASDASELSASIDALRLQIAPGPRTTKIA